MWPNLQETAAFVTFTEEILNGKLHFFVQWLYLGRKQTYQINTCSKSTIETLENVVK